MEKYKTHYKAKLKMNVNTPVSCVNMFEIEFRKTIERFNKKFKGTGCSITIKRKKV